MGGDDRSASVDTSRVFPLSSLYISLRLIHIIPYGA
jgi:hypothetical protein